MNDMYLCKCECTLIYMHLPVYCKCRYLDIHMYGLYALNHNVRKWLRVRSYTKYVKKWMSKHYFFFYILVVPVTCHMSSNNLIKSVLVQSVNDLISKWSVMIIDTSK